ncbi:hypothetical protein [Planococcus lenghuensis]|uniref:Uncharacterized protein n=1 Tax=Planococcus lenghuensis TaxID=2213202 RepID=A0A1Q2KXN7_9BACL|nr:hypothetical protein [Planococcus lenghuensis]AQQ52886.1 hypothetical protein B0X71_07145 [Planococcus lenghuensis]
MKLLKNQQGYALLVVLLIVVLFLTMSATFMMKSLTNAKQEQTIDTSNQSVASAEMGARFYSSDFERELQLIKQDIAIQTQTEINLLIDCIKAREAKCDDPADIPLREAEIDEKMRTLYIKLIEDKIAALDTLANSGTEVIPFSADQINYSITSAAGTRLNAAEEDISLATTMDKKIRFIEVELGMSGTSKSVTKTLDALFKIDVPNTFLNPSESLIIETVVPVDKEAVTYEDVFSTSKPTISCTQLVADIIANPSGYSAPFECLLDGSTDLADLITQIEAGGLDPELFKVYTDNFVENICTTECNSLDFKGITIVVNPDDAEAIKNMNNLINANLLVNGELLTGNNLINLGKNNSKQTIIVKELNVGSNIQNLYYTNFLVLGLTEATPGDLIWGQNIEIDNYSNFCIDIDRINPDHLKRLANEVKFTNSGKLIYFTRYNDGATRKEFVLTGNKVEERSKSVVRIEDYTTFLNACGVTLKDSVTETTEVAVPNILDPGIDIKILY